MTAVARRSPKINYGEAPDQLRLAVETLEDRPRIPNKTPASQTADGYDGEICQDANYLYVYDEMTQWSRFAKSW